MVAPLPLQRLQDRIDKLELERTRLLALVEILREVSGAYRYASIVQAVVRRMGHLFGLERCSVLLASRAGGHQVYLVASFEDPSIRNYPMDLSRYPEIRRAMETGQVVYIPDAQADPALAAVSNQLASRGVKSITVVPMTWGTRVIGTLFLRTDQAGQPVTADDIEFTRLVAEVTARALRLAYRVEQIEKRQNVPDELFPDLQHAALVAFTHRLMGEFLAREKDPQGRQLSETWSKKLDRMVESTLAALTSEQQTGPGSATPA